MCKKRCTAVILSAGSGSRMKSKVAKQYLMLGEKPVIWYALRTVEESAVIDDCVLVTAEGDMDFVRREIVDKYQFTKVQAIIPGGAERYASVARALEALRIGECVPPNRDGYIFIHDGARPFLTEKILQDTYEAVQKHHACVAAVPSKDTIKIADEEGYAVQTPDRRHVWSIQTPQVFDAQLIMHAYAALTEQIVQIQQQGIAVTDDAGVVELFTDYRVKMVPGAYENIKITTPEDIKTAEAFLQ